VTEKTVGWAKIPEVGFIEIVQLPSKEEIESIVAEMITSAPVGTVEAEHVIKGLEIMKVRDPEQYRETIERMIVADRGEHNE